MACAFYVDHLFDFFNLIAVFCIRIGLLLVSGAENQVQVYDLHKNRARYTTVYYTFFASVLHLRDYNINDVPTFGCNLLLAKFSFCFYNFVIYVGATFEIPIYVF
jgi:hypothetical protein